MQYQGEIDGVVGGEGGGHEGKFEPPDTAVQRATPRLQNLSVFSW